MLRLSASAALYPGMTPSCRSTTAVLQYLKNCKYIHYIIGPFSEATPGKLVPQKSPTGESLGTIRTFIFYRHPTISINALKMYVHT